MTKSMMKALSSKRPAPPDPEKVDLLLRFFQSQFFNEWIAVQYLYQSTQPGVHDYLCNKLFELSEQELDAYLLQLVNLAHTLPGGSLEHTLVELASRSFKLALKMYWLLLALGQDNPKNKHLETLRDNVEKAALHGRWVVPFRNPTLDPLSPVMSPPGTGSPSGRISILSPTYQPPPPLIMDGSSRPAPDLTSPGQQQQQQQEGHLLSLAGGGAASAAMQHHHKGSKGELHIDLGCLLAPELRGLSMEEVRQLPEQQQQQQEQQQRSSNEVQEQQQTQCMGSGVDSRPQIPRSQPQPIPPPSARYEAGQPRAERGSMDHLNHIRQELGSGEGVTSLLERSRRGPNGMVVAVECEDAAGNGCLSDDEAPGATPMSPTQRSREQTFVATLDFIEALCEASSSLNNFSQEERHRALRNGLEGINREIEAAARKNVAIWFPMGAHNERVLRLTAKEAVLLNSRDKAPFMLYVEVLQTEDDLPSHLATHQQQPGASPAGPAPHGAPSPEAMPLEEAPNPEAAAQEGTVAMPATTWKVPASPRQPQPYSADAVAAAKAALASEPDRPSSFTSVASFPAGPMVIPSRSKSNLDLLALGRGSPSALSRELSSRASVASAISEVLAGLGSFSGMQQQQQPQHAGGGGRSSRTSPRSVTGDALLASVATAGSYSFSSGQQQHVVACRTSAPLVPDNALGMAMDSAGACVPTAAAKLADTADKDLASVLPAAAVVTVESRSGGAAAAPTEADSGPSVAAAAQSAAPLSAPMSSLTRPQDSEEPGSSSTGNLAQVPAAAAAAAAAAGSSPVSNRKGWLLMRHADEEPARAGSSSSSLVAAAGSAAGAKTSPTPGRSMRQRRENQGGGSSGGGGLSGVVRSFCFAGDPDGGAPDPLSDGDIDATRSVARTASELARAYSEPAVKPAGGILSDAELQELVNSGYMSPVPRKEAPKSELVDRMSHALASLRGDAPLLRLHINVLPQPPPPAPPPEEFSLVPVASLKTVLSKFGLFSKPPEVAAHTAAQSGRLVSVRLEVAGGLDLHIVSPHRKHKRTPSVEALSLIASKYKVQSIPPAVAMGPPIVPMDTMDEEESEDEGLTGASAEQLEACASPQIDVSGPAGTSDADSGSRDGSMRRAERSFTFRQARINGSASGNGDGASTAGEQAGMSEASSSGRFAAMSAEARSGSSVPRSWRGLSPQHRPPPRDASMGSKSSPRGGSPVGRKQQPSPCRTARASSSGGPLQHQRQADHGQQEGSPHLDPALAAKRREAAAVYGERWAHKVKRIQRESPHGRRPGWALRCVIVKNGDDCRQEHLAVQLIRTFKDVFAECSLPLWVRYYDVLVTSNRTALIEMIPDALSIHTVKHRSPPGSTFSDHFFAKFVRGTPECVAAQRRFTESLAAYSIITYLLQIKDRHNGNVLVDDEGRLVHIDFGFMLSNTPGGVNFESAPFKLTRELLEVMDSNSDGRPSELFDYYKVLLIQGFLACRKHSDRIVLLVKMMAKSGLPCFKAGPERTVKGVEKRLALNLTEVQIVQMVLSLISDSLDAWRTRQYDYYQRVMNGIL